MSKINDLRKRGISLLTAAFTVVSLSGCVQVPEDYPEEFIYVEQETNHFEDFHKTVIRDGEPVTVYSGKNIFLVFDKETFDVKEYICNKGSITMQMYDLLTGYLLVNVSIFTQDVDNDYENYEKLIDDNYIVELVNISDYLEDEEVKEWYTLDEIKELEPKIIESLKLINEYDSKVKVK